MGGGVKPLIFDTTILSRYSANSDCQIETGPNSNVAIRRTTSTTGNHELTCNFYQINGNRYKYIRIKANKINSIYSDLVWLRFGPNGSSYKPIFTTPSLTVGINDRVINTETGTVGSGGNRDDYYAIHNSFRIYMWAAFDNLIEYQHIGFYESLAQLENYKLVHG